MPPLFGQNPSNTNLFGNSLFSNTNQSQPASSSAPAGHSKSQSSSNIFGGFGISQTQPASTAGGGGGLFGSSTNNTQAPANQPLFGQKNDLPTGTADGSNSFMAKPSGQANELGQPIDKQGSENTNHSGYFSSLLEKGKKRPRAEEGSGFGEIPSLQLGLGDIAQRVKALVGGHSQGSGARGVDSKA